MRFTRLFEQAFTESTTIQGDLNQDTFVDLLAKHKAILLRSDEDETPYTVHDFARIIQTLKLDEYEYIGGAAPRRIIPTDVPGVTVYTANEAPPDQLIPFHHELAQVKNPPQFIFFYCDLPSETGGETALIDSTLVYRFVNESFPHFMEKLKNFGYVLQH